MLGLGLVWVNLVMGGSLVLALGWRQLGNGLRRFRAHISRSGSAAAPKNKVGMSLGKARLLLTWRGLAWPCLALPDLACMPSRRMAHRFKHDGLLPKLLANPPPSMRRFLSRAQQASSTHEAQRAVHHGTNIGPAAVT